MVFHIKKIFRYGRSGLTQHPRIDTLRSRLLLTMLIFTALNIARVTMVDAQQNDTAIIEERNFSTCV